MRRVDSCVGEARRSCRSLVQQLPRWRQRYIDGGMWQPLLAYHEWFVHLLGIKRFANLWPEVNRFFVDSEAELDEELEGAMEGREVEHDALLPEKLDELSLRSRAVPRAMA